MTAVSRQQNLSRKDCVFYSLHYDPALFGHRLNLCQSNHPLFPLGSFIIAVCLV